MRVKVGTRISFLFGLTSGIVLTLFLADSTSISSIRSTFQHSQFRVAKNIRSLLDLSSLKQMTANSVEGHGEFDQRLQTVKSAMIDDASYHSDNESVAKDLEKTVRVLCWIMTSPTNLDKKAIHVKKTWAKRCNIMLFVSSKHNASFPAIGLDVKEGRQHLTSKTMQAFRYVYDHYKHLADWFMKADDDTYVILENLRYFLKDYNKHDPVFFGHHFKTIVKQGYYSGGAGYVLSLEALTRLVTIGKNPSFCRQDGGSEDAEIGKCMQRLGVKTINSTDAMGRSRFHCFNPEAHLFGEYPNWYYQYDANGARKGTDSISDYAISFHYVPPKKMYALEFYIYHLRPYGIEFGHQHLNVHNGY